MPSTRRKIICTPDCNTDGSDDKRPLTKFVITIAPCVISCGRFSKIPSAICVINSNPLIRSAGIPAAIPSKNWFKSSKPVEIRDGAFSIMPVNKPLTIFPAACIIPETPFSSNPFVSCSIALIAAGNNDSVSPSDIGSTTSPNNCCALSFRVEISPLNV